MNKIMYQIKPARKGDKDRAISKSLLHGYYQLPEEELPTGRHWLKKLVFDKFKVPKRDQHVVAVTIAYAFFIEWKDIYDSEEFKATLIKLLGLERVTKRTQLLNLAVRFVTSGDPRWCNDRKMISRDVRALKWAMVNGLTPNDLLPLAQQAGEGLDKWSHRWTDIKPSD